ncbi:hypothetical protein [Oligoflexus tunisiensis]|uniref:hypothetical protein n=1 Tax=Oligoflexus tunisiensis TaxID=708132 RepID=UPI00114D38FE|nr:hypothetical protein [Oligoflexus tunisiensis]
MFKNATLALGLIALSAPALAQNSQAARLMNQAAQTAQATIGGIKAKCAPHVKENRNDIFILDVLIPEIEERLLQSEQDFSEAADLLDVNESDFNGRRAFRSGCLATARAALKLGTAKIKSVDANIFKPYSIEFEDVKFDIDTARADARC